MATTHQVIDPRGDLLLCFPGTRPGPGARPGLGAVTFFNNNNNNNNNHGGAANSNPSSFSPPSSPTTSPSTVCADLNAPSSSSHSGPNQDNTTILLQVSSSVLCLASPVFSAMLSGPLSEGLAFRSPSSPRPFPLTLPEDCGVTFAILASILHFRTSNIPFLPRTTTLLALARLADKYGCTMALTSHAEIWMHRALERNLHMHMSTSTTNTPSSSQFHHQPLPPPPTTNESTAAQTAWPTRGDDDGRLEGLEEGEEEGGGGEEEEETSAFTNLCSLLLFAYSMDLPAPFARISWEVMLHHRQQLKGETEFGLDLPVPVRGGELLRHDLHGEIAKRKARLRREIHAALMEPISRVTAHLTFPGGSALPVTGTSTTATTNNTTNTNTNNPATSTYPYPYPPYAHPPPSHQQQQQQQQSQQQPPGYLLRDPTGNSSPSSSVVPATCPNAAMAMGNYMAFLDAHNLCPWRPQYETDSFASIIARAMDAANQARDDPALRFEMCSRSRCRCSAMAYGDGVHLAQRLAWAMSGALQLKLFACLDCLKNGNDGHATCRVKHS